MIGMSVEKFADDAVENGHSQTVCEIVHNDNLVMWRMD